MQGNGSTGEELSTEELNRGVAAKWAPRFLPPGSAPVPLVFSDSEDPDEDGLSPAVTNRIPRQIRMTEDLERQLDQLERLQDKLGHTPVPPLEPPQEERCRTPEEPPADLESDSPLASPRTQLEHERRQVRDLARALATERRARREFSREVEQLQGELMAAHEANQDATERAQQIEEDYLAAQQALSKAASDHVAVRRNSRAMAERLRQCEGELADGLAKPPREKLAELSIAQLDEMEQRHASILAEIRAAKEAARQAECLRLQQECQQLSESKLCAVCMAAEADATFVHGESGHQACCHGCALQVKQSTGKCPICNQEIEAVIRHFNA